MSDTYNIYGETYAAEMSDIEHAGRYLEQSDGERWAVLDIVDKLQLVPQDSILDIGSGPGNFLIPLSFLVARSTAMDNAGAIARVRSRFQAPNVDYVTGSFPEAKPTGTFSKVLIYSVLHCLGSLDQVREFVFQAVDCLDYGGRMLLGDLPNSDLKARFLNSETGRRFDAEWRASRKPLSETVSGFHARMAESGMIGTFNDAFLLSLQSELRAMGLHAYLVPQKPDMPFGHTREDIVVIKPR